MTIYTIATDALTCSIEAADHNEAARKFAAAEIAAAEAAGRASIWADYVIETADDLIAAAKDMGGKASVI